MCCSHAIVPVHLRGAFGRVKAAVHVTQNRSTRSGPHYCYCPALLPCSTAPLSSPLSSAAGHYDQSVDIWASGCIFAELLGRQPLFPGADFKQTLQMHLKVLGSRPAGASPPSLGHVQQPSGSLLD